MVRLAMGKFFLKNLLLKVTLHNYCWICTPGLNNHVTCLLLNLTGILMRIDVWQMPEKMNLNQERDLVTVECCQCVRDLLGSPVLQKHMNYKLERVYGDDDRKSAVFDEILGCTANWWDTQVIFSLLKKFLMLTNCTKKLPTEFKGGEGAWTVHLTLGNVSKSMHRSPAGSSRSAVQLASRSES